MPEWMLAEGAGSAPGIVALAGRLALALLVGLAIAGVFVASQRRPARDTVPLGTTLVLLTMLVAMTTIVIGDSVARAFGLVGALSIVRFRTVVEDTRDTSFVIFAVVTGMALGAGHLLVCAVGVPLVSFAALGLGVVGRGMVRAHPRRLEIRVSAGRDPATLLAGTFSSLLTGHALQSAVSSRQGASLDLVYRVSLRDPEGMLALLKAVLAIEGVQSAEIREA